MLIEIDLNTSSHSHLSVLSSEHIQITQNSLPKSHCSCIGDSSHFLETYYRNEKDHFIQCGTNL